MHFSLPKSVKHSVDVRTNASRTTKNLASKAPLLSKALYISLFISVVATLGLPLYLYVKKVFLLACKPWLEPR